MTQLAMSVVLLVGGTLFVRSLFVARAIDVGFDQSNRLLLSVNVGLQNYDETRGRRFFDDVLTRTRSLPGVIAATWAFPVPFDTYGRGISLYAEGARTNAKDGTVGTDATFVTDDFIKTLGLRLQAGRDVSAADTAGAPPVMLVSRSLATRLWPGKDPVGQRARRGGASGPEVMVVGVVGDATFASLGERSHDRAYVPLRQRYRDWETLIVHTRGEPATVLPQVRAVIASIDPTLPTFGVMTLQQSVESGFATSRMAASIAGFFAALALLIAAVGLYAGGGARLGAWGLVIGLVCAVVVAKLMAGLLYGLSPSDPLTFVLAPIALALVVLIATYLPARRAVGLDPMAALRSD